MFVRRAPARSDTPGQAADGRGLVRFSIWSLCSLAFGPRGVIADPLVFAGPSAEKQVTIGKFRAREIDCSEIAGMFPDTLIDSEGRILLPPSFMKGFVIIKSGTQLNVVAVYTAAVFMEGEKSRPSGLSMDVEVIQPFVANVIGRQ